jgi:hypothetical protein
MLVVQNLDDFVMRVSSKIMLARTEFLLLPIVETSKNRPEEEKLMSSRIEF